MEVLDVTVGQLARENFSVIQLFNRNNVDFFCKGTRTLREALSEAGVGEENFLKALKEIRSHEPQKYPVDVDQWPLDLLADYVEKIHHRYTTRVLSDIRDMTKNPALSEPDEAKVIGDFIPVFDILSAGLATHMKKEELMLFPAVRKMVMKRAGGNVPVFGSVDKSVSAMIDEHDTQYQALRKIRNIMNNYETREGRNDYNKIVDLMRGLDEDLGLHIHLENNILFPKAVELANESG